MGVTLAFANSLLAGPTDDQLMDNRLYILEGQSKINEAIWNYDGMDPAVRFAQFILWVGGYEGGGGRNEGGDDGEEGGGEEGEGSGGEGGESNELTFGGNPLDLIEDWHVRDAMNTNTMMTLTPVPGSPCKEHRILIPLSGDADEGFEMVDGQLAFLETYGRTGLRFAALRISLNEDADGNPMPYVTIEPVIAADSPVAPFAICLSVNRDGAVDRVVTPVLLDSESPDPVLAIKYDDGFIAYANGSSSNDGTEEGSSREDDESSEDLTVWLINFVEEEAGLAK